MSGWANRFVFRATMWRAVAAGVLLLAIATVIGSSSSGSASAASAATPVPITIDTDIYSSVDDVGALAVGFALQQKGEAKVIAIGVDTRTDRPTVATNSWKCTAAIAQFYFSGNVPIGTDGPGNGTTVNDPDFVGPC